MDEFHKTVVEPEVADAGISLSIRLPLVLDPEERNPGGLVVRAWSATSGDVLFTRRLDIESLNDAAGIGGLVARMARPVPPFLMVAYDGDDGLIMHATVVDADTVDVSDISDEQRGTNAENMLLRVLGAAHADPDQPCNLCSDGVPEGADIDPQRVHRECLLANVIGPLGHHLDHEFWCRNMADPNAGLGARQANLKVATLVDRYGLQAVLNGDFPREDP